MEHHVDTLVAPVAPVGVDVPPPIVPVPMSFPALLINPKSRVAQLRTGKEVRGPVKPVEITGKGQGKRWIRRAENSTSFSAVHLPSQTHSTSQAPLGTTHISLAPQRAITTCRTSKSVQPSLDPFLLTSLASVLPLHQ